MSVREIIDNEVQTHVVGWWSVRELANSQSVGWTVPKYSSDLNATSSVYPAMQAKGHGPYTEFLKLIGPSSSPMAVCIAALQVVARHGLKQ